MGRIRWEGDGKSPEVRLKGTIEKEASDGYPLDHCTINLDCEEPYKLDISNAGPFFDLENGDKVEIVVRLLNPRGPTDTLPREEAK